MRTITSAKYAVLHAHTATGSVGDSVLKVNDYVNKAKKLGLTHIAVTDHGSMASMAEFHEACEKASITGIIGMEAYVADNRLDKTPEHQYEAFHLVLLAKNKNGVKNLLRIHNDAQITGFYRFPKTDISVLKKYGRDIIALSACVGGKIPKQLLNKDIDGAVKTIREYQECFDELYLEIQPGNFKEQHIINNMLAVLSKKLKIPLAATNDIHYLDAADYKMHDCHIKSCGHKNSYPDKCYYLHDYKSFIDSFQTSRYLTKDMIIEAVNNTNNIADKCDGEIDYGFKMPQYKDLPQGETEESFLAKICIAELKKRSCILSDPSVYEERLQYELNVITRLGFCGYFLIVMDFLDYARSNNIAVGPGRGSVAGSIVAWLLNITVADPIKHNLLFERFLSDKRKSLPDIDMDFDSAKRNQLKDYAIEKYGKNHVAMVGTFGIRKAKDAIRAAGRLLDTDLETVNKICKAAPFKVKDSDGEDIISPTIQDMLNSSTKFKKEANKVNGLIQTAINMESFPKSVGIHAAGVVIMPDDIMDKIPVRVDKSSGYIVTSIDKHYIEKFGIKYDFLAIGSIGTIDKTIKDTGVSIDLNDPEFYKDTAVWNTIGSVNTIGMFQISSDLYRQRMPRLKPQNLQQMAACLALVRGPCISARTDEVYMRIVNNEQDIKHIDSKYDMITKNTNGICIYQEEVMQLGNAYGLTLEESYKLMKLLSKKQIEKIKEMKEQFYEKARAIGTKDSIIDEVYAVIENAGKYSFNASHAVSYGIITYLSAWLKYHYPLYYMANLLTDAYISKKDDKKIEAIVNDCRRLGIRFMQVNANESNWEFSVKDNKIQIGLCAIKSFGEIAAKSLIKNRPYNDVSDIIKVYTLKGSKINKKSLTALILSDAFNYLDVSYDSIFYEMAYAKAIKTQQKTGDFTIESSLKISSSCELSPETEDNIRESELLRANYLFYTGSDINPVQFDAIKTGSVFNAVLCISSVKTINDRNGNRMAFVKFATRTESFDGIVFSSLYATAKKAVKTNTVVNITAKKDKSDSCIVQSLTKAE